MAGGEELPQSLERGSRLESSDRVDFDPVAGGEDNRFLGNSRSAQHLQGRWNAGFSEGEAFPECNRRRVMTKTDDN
jgi:hypothetical protein